MQASDTDSLKRLPVRQRLTHTPPAGVSQYSVGAEYFVTICVDRTHYGIEPSDTGRNGPLANAAIANTILDAVDFRLKLCEWYPRFALIMPDHVHVITSFSTTVPMEKSIANWKRFLATKCGIVWQVGFFDHRLRNEAERVEKWQYIEMNPVAKGLCNTSEEWPFRRVW